MKTVSAQILNEDSRVGEEPTGPCVHCRKKGTGGTGVAAPQRGTTPSALVVAPAVHVGFGGGGVADVRGLSVPHQDGARAVGGGGVGQHPHRPESVRDRKAYSE